MTDERIIVALDCGATEARTLARELSGRVTWLKVGMTLFYAEGPRIVADLAEQGFRIFLDLKLHDIPHQVGGAAASIARLGVGMFTVHASGGAAMLAAAVEGSREAARAAGLPAPSVLGISVLTSTDDATLRSTGVERTPAEQVALLSSLAAAAGVDGMVCSPREAAAVASALPAGSLVVTPGVRPAWASSDDQSRIATPDSALRAGATHLVIGRPITAAESPVAAVDRILSEIEGVAR